MYHSNPLKNPNATDIAANVAIHEGLNVAATQSVAVARLLHATNETSSTATAALAKVADDLRRAKAACELATRRAAEVAAELASAIDEISQAADVTSCKWIARSYHDAKQLACGTGSTQVEILGLLLAAAATCLWIGLCALACLRPAAVVALEWRDRPPSQQGGGWGEPIGTHHGGEASGTGEGGGGSSAFALWGSGRRSPPLNDSGGGWSGRLEFGGSERESVVMERESPFAYYRQQALGEPLSGAGRPSASSMSMAHEKQIGRLVSSPDWPADRAGITTRSTVNSSASLYPDVPGSAGSALERSRAGAKSSSVVGGSMGRSWPPGSADGPGGAGPSGACTEPLLMRGTHDTSLSFNPGEESDSASDGSASSTSRRRRSSSTMRRASKFVSKTLFGGGSKKPRDGGGRRRSM